MRALHVSLTFSHVPHFRSRRSCGRTRTLPTLLNYASSATLWSQHSRAAFRDASVPGRQSHPTPYTDVERAHRRQRVARRPCRRLLGVSHDRCVGAASAAGRAGGTDPDGAVGDADGGVLFTPEQYEAFKEKRLREPRLYVSWRPIGTTFECRLIGPESKCSVTRLEMGLGIG